MSPERYRIVFMGTPEFAVPTLKTLCDTENVTLVVTNPDRPRGRGRKLTPPPVKVEAEERGIPVYQPQRLKGNQEAVERISGENPDLIVVVAYGKILPPEILEIPPLGCINVHASILPELRGAAPIQWALIKGMKETGITIMKMDEGMDTGPILLVERVPIEEDDDAGTLSGKLSVVGAKALRKALDLLKKGELTEASQDNERATYAPMIKKEMGEINWREDACKIRNLIRGLNPSPGAFTWFRGKFLKITRAAVEEAGSFGRGEPGKVVEVRKDGLVVVCGEGFLRIEKVKPEGKKEMDAWAFTQGYRVEPGECLGR